MENKGRPVQSLLIGLSKLGVQAKGGDTVFFGRRRQPTIEEMEARMEAIRREIHDHEASKNRRGGT